MNIDVFPNSRAYDIAKYVAQVVLPGLGTLYFALSGIWGFPNGEQVIGTITAVDVFLGLLLGLSNSTYTKNDDNFDGVMEVQKSTDDEGFEKTVFSLNLNSQPDALPNKDVVNFKVKDLDEGPKHLQP